MYRISQAVASHAVAAEGIDALVFTAGIGEHAAPVRADICKRLAWLGVQLDEEANNNHSPRISQADSPISAWVIRTNEECVIARETWKLTRQE
jgi:acetate kinase